VLLSLTPAAADRLLTYWDSIDQKGYAGGGDTPLSQDLAPRYSTESVSQHKMIGHWFYYFYFQNFAAIPVSCSKTSFVRAGMRCRR